MTKPLMDTLLQHLRRTARLREQALFSDEQLLADFIAHQDKEALSLLIERHGPMVWGVCRRILHHEHDAEDAFQATFLVLVRKANSVHPRKIVGNWLYGVARQTALKARATLCTRKSRERSAAEMPDPVGRVQANCEELLPILDEELSRLPDKYRSVVVLCDLEGRTRRVVAQQLGVPEGTVAGRLARARALLATRFAQRGVVLSSGIFSAALAQQALAGVPSLVIAKTIQVANMYATGQALVLGMIPLKVTALTEGVLQAMFLTKLKMTVALVLMLGLVGTGATLLIGRSSAQPIDKQPVAERAVPPETKPEPENAKEPFTAWGEELNGLQAGLGYRLDEQRSYHPGETVKVVLRLRNTSKAPVDFKHIWAYFVENPPKVTAADGQVMPLARVSAMGLQRPRITKVDPGNEVELYQWEFKLRPEGDLDKRARTLQGQGKLTLQCERIVGTTSGNSEHPNPMYDKLTTGKLTLEVKEPFTAWGQEVGGLQAGLGLVGEQRTYRHGETCSLVVRVRNVSKQAVKFEYMPQFLDEKPPTVTSAEGKTIQQAGLGVLGIHFPVSVTLEPGKGMTLTTRMCESGNIPYLLIPPKSKLEQDSNSSPLFVGTGKTRLQIDKVFGNSSSGFLKVDPVLGKLATGTLELDVQEALPKK